MEKRKQGLFNLYVTELRYDNRIWNNGYNGIVWRRNKSVILQMGKCIVTNTMITGFSIATCL